mgnify:CR=1 FL=1
MKQGVQSLFKTLAFVKEVRCHQWEDVRNIIAAINDHTAFVEGAVWKNYKAGLEHHYPLDLSDIKTWGTHDKRDCIKLVFSIDKADRLVCDVTINEGDSFNGFYKGPRFTATLAFKKAYIKNIEKNILWALNQKADWAYEQHLEAQKILWVENFKKEILSNEYSK